jgi:serine/threonine protein phosphatase PrpC
MSARVGLVCSKGVGAARGGRDRNEDSFLICADRRMRWREADGERSEPGDGQGVLVGVFDGMGGHRDGDVASGLAARMMSKLYDRCGVPRDPARALRRHVLDTHRSLHFQARAKGPVKMGTTLTACWILDGGAHWIHVGDSRLYAWRAGSLTKLTRDQTANEFARRDGRPELPEGDGLAQNFIYGSRGLGDDGALRLETVRDGGSVTLEVGDRLLLCSDGFSGILDDQRIALLLGRESDPQAAAELCAKTAMASGSRDNITVLVLSIEAPLQRTKTDDYWDEDDTSTTGVF